MKRSTLATFLNFVVPGAGLWYLGHRLWCVVNLCVATAIVLGAGSLAPDLLGERIHYVFIAVAAGSAGLAHAIALGERRDASQGAE